jgi:hypothetical protein
LLNVIYINIINQQQASNDLSQQPPNYDIIVAIIALVSSAITAAATAIFTKKNEVRLKHLENELAIDIDFKHHSFGFRSKWK